MTNTSDHTIPPNTALSRFIHVSGTINATLVPVSAFILWPFAGGTNSTAWGKREDDDCKTGNIKDDESENIGSERGVKENQCDGDAKFSARGCRKRENGGY